MEREFSAVPYIAEIYAGELHPDLDNALPERADLMDQNVGNVNYQFYRKQSA